MKGEAKKRKKRRVNRKKRRKLSLFMAIVHVLVNEGKERINKKNGKRGKDEK